MALENLATRLQVFSALAAADLSNDWQAGLQAVSGLLIEAVIVVFGLTILRSALLSKRQVSV